MIVPPLLDCTQVGLKGWVVLVYWTLEFYSRKAVGWLSLPPKQRSTSSHLNKRKEVFFHYYDLLCFDVIASIPIPIDSPAVRLSASPFDCPSANQDNIHLHTIDMQFQPTHESLNNWNPPHLVELMQILLDMARPVKLFYLGGYSRLGIHP